MAKLAWFCEIIWHRRCDTNATPKCLKGMCNGRILSTGTGFFPEIRLFVWELAKPLVRRLSNGSNRVVWPHIHCIRVCEPFWQHYMRNTLQPSNMISGISGWKLAPRKKVMGWYKQRPDDRHTDLWEPERCRGKISASHLRVI